MKNSMQFEDAIKELEEITNKIQQNDLSLEETVNYYEKGKKLIKFCQEKLESVEQKIKIIENNQEKDISNDEF